jgi:hypothetical protein
MHALELPAGTLESSVTAVGDVVTWAAQPEFAGRDTTGRTEVIS